MAPNDDEWVTAAVWKPGLLHVTERSFLLLSSRKLPGVCGIAPMRAPIRSTVQVAPGGGVETITVWLPPFTMVAQADKNAKGMRSAVLSIYPTNKK